MNKISFDIVFNVAVVKMFFVHKNSKLGLKQLTKGALFIHLDVAFDILKNNCTRLCDAE